MRIIVNLRPVLAIALAAACFHALYAADASGPSSQFDNVISSATTVAAVDVGPAGAAVDHAALARASHKLAAAIDVTDRFADEAAAQGLERNWRYGMIANMMKGDEANFAAVALAANLDKARIAAQEVAALGVPVAGRTKNTKSITLAAQSAGFGASTVDLVYVPISPCRILDTRASGALLAAGSISDYYYGGGNVGAAPCSAGAANASGAAPAAVAINATVVSGDFSGSGYLAIYPEGTTRNTSFLNYYGGEIKANAGVISLNPADGDFEVFNQQPTSLIIDVFGLFTTPGTLTSATGTDATALGQGTTATGDNSTALGYYTTAAGAESTAMGHFSTAKGAAPFSIAAGYAAQTNGPSAMALGNHTQALGDSSTALGYYTLAGAQRATAMGDATFANADGATAMGSGTQATAGSATAMGASAIASGAFSTAMGASTQAQGAGSTAMGKQTVASGDFSTAMGYSNTANGYVATAMGLSNTASGNMSLATGYNNTASGFASFAGGQGNQARETGSVALGIRAVAQQPYSFVFNGKSDTTFYAHDGDGSFNVSTPSGGGIDFEQAGQYCYMNDHTSGWQCSSDRNLKKGIVPIDDREILAKLVALPVSTWVWKTDHHGYRHLGPMAQDFMAAFHLGGDDKAISSTDAQGVALAAIKGLHAELRDRDAKLADQAKQIAALNAKFAAQQERMAAFEALADGLAQMQRSGRTAPGAAQALTVRDSMPQDGTPNTRSRELERMR